MSGETEDRPSGWTTDTLHTHLIRQLEALKDYFDSQIRLMRQMTVERHEAQGKAVDKAFDAQQTAMSAALSSAERAVEAALAAAKEAVLVANVASEKRFDSVNEFRGQLQDIIRTLMPRAEAEAVIGRMNERIHELAAASAACITRVEAVAMSDRNSERIAELTSRVDKAEARAAGAEKNKAGIYAAIASVGVILGILVVVANFLSGD